MDTFYCSLRDWTPVYLLEPFLLLTRSNSWFGYVSATTEKKTTELKLGKELAFHKTVYCADTSSKLLSHQRSFSLKQKYWIS